MAPSAQAFEDFKQGGLENIFSFQDPQVSLGEGLLKLF